jgi:hypothetical protein
MLEKLRLVAPETKLGRWSLWLIIAMPFLFLIGSSFANSLYGSTSAGETILADLRSRPALALSMLAGMAAGVGAFLTGLLAITRQKEKALLVYLAAGIGALLILFLAAEFAFPH